LEGLDTVTGKLATKEQGKQNKNSKKKMIPGKMDSGQSDGGIPTRSRASRKATEGKEGRLKKKTSNGVGGGGKMNKANTIFYGRGWGGGKQVHRNTGREREKGYLPLFGQQKKKGPRRRSGNGKSPNGYIGCGKDTAYPGEKREVMI